MSAHRDQQSVLCEDSNGAHLNAALVDGRVRSLGRGECQVIVRGEDVVRVCGFGEVPAGLTALEGLVAGSEDEEDFLLCHFDGVWESCKRQVGGSKDVRKIMGKSRESL